MRRKLGKAIAENNGYAVHHIYLVDESGNYIPAGFAVLNPEGELLGAFATLEAAKDALAEWSEPKSGPSLGM